MEIEEYKKLSAIEKLRMVVNTFSYCNEDFSMRFSVDELMKLHEASMASNWDFLPHEWTERQIKEALQGIVPDWDDNEKSIYHPKKK